MTFLPVVQRELGVRSRRVWTYWGRPLAAFVPLGLVGVFGLLGGRGGGKGLFDVLVVLATLYGLLEGVRQTADCVSEEKRAGTLGLLFLTELHGYDVVLGKFVAASLGSFYSLMAAMPIMGLALLLGGVTAGEFWRSMLALWNVLFASLSMGMLVSTFSRDLAGALVRTALGLVAWMGLPLLGEFWRAWSAKAAVTWVVGMSPLQALQAAGTGQGYWSSWLTVQAMGWVCLGIACVALPRVWREGGSVAGAHGARPRKRRPRSPAQAAALAECLEGSPLAWLVARSAGSHGLAHGLVVGLVVLAAVVGGVVGELAAAGMIVSVGLSVMALFLQVRVAWAASELLAELRRSETLGLVLTTPVASQDVVFDLGMGLWRHFKVPLLVLAGIQVVTAVGMALVAPNDLGGRVMTFLPWGPGSLLWILHLFTDFYALIYAGLWFGLRTGKPVQAFVRTLVLVVLGGGLLCCGYRFLPDLVIAVFMRQRLLRDLRRVGTGDDRGGWRPVAGFSGLTCLSRRVRNVAC